MSSPKYDHQKIREYLLGSLPDAEAERFDELSFTDEEFADALRIAERDLVDAYVQGELGGAALEKFQSHYLASPLRREKVSFASSFQKFAGRKITRTSSEDATAQTNKTEQSAGLLSLINNFITSNPILSWSFAALLLVFTALGGFWVFNQRPATTTREMSQTPTNRQTPATAAVPDVELSEPTEEQAVLPSPEKEITPADKALETPTQPQELAREKTKKQSEPNQPGESEPARLPKTTIASFILTPPLRSGNQLLTLSVPRKTREIAIRLELESADYAYYRVALVDQANRQLWNSPRLKAKSSGENKFLDVRFPAGLLKSQIFSLVVSGVKAEGGEAEIISNYPFRAVLK